MHDYLLANSGMTKKEKLFAFCVRSQMLEVKKNFKVGKSDLNCSLGCDTTEDQEQHLLWCPVLREDDDDLIDYKDIYSQDHLKVKEEVTRILMTKFYKFLRLKATVHGKSLQLNSREKLQSRDGIYSVSRQDPKYQFVDLCPILRSYTK